MQVRVLDRQRSAPVTPVILTNLTYMHMQRCAMSIENLTNVGMSYTVGKLLSLSALGNQGNTNVYSCARNGRAWQLPLIEALLSWIKSTWSIIGNFH